MTIGRNGHRTELNSGMNLDEKLRYAEELVTAYNLPEDQIGTRVKEIYRSALSIAQRESETPEQLQQSVYPLVQIAKNVAWNRVNKLPPEYHGSRQQVIKSRMEEIRDVFGDTSGYDKTALRLALSS